jgi:hypothetical protein
MSNNEWQPIETAPKEPFVNLLLYDVAQDKVSIGWKFYDELDWSTETYIRDFNPTHWLPIPKPPTQ